MSSTACRWERFVLAKKPAGFLIVWVLFPSVVFLFYFLPLTVFVSLLLQAWETRSGVEGRNLTASNAWLVIASLCFYAWGEARLLWVLILSGSLSFFGGKAVGNRSGRRRTAALYGFVGGEIMLLIFFKYGGLIEGIFTRIGLALGDHAGPESGWKGIALPLGISFFTFHGISYVVDIYKGRIAPVRRPVDFACYFSMFPQLVAGPIVRYSEVAVFFQYRVVTTEDVYWGLRRFVAGLGKKVLIANQVSVLADASFALPLADCTAATAWLGTLAYALQIYFDFSGYSDMAIGMGRLFGFRFPENFDQPYLATTVREFWRRWHMTLSRFFRDYLYIPLGGSRTGSVRTYVNLVVVFALCGLWHGASWNFLSWGLFYGVFLAVEHAVAPNVTRRPGWLQLIGHIYTLAVVLFAWVLFRCETWEQSLATWHAMLDLGHLSRIGAIPWNALSPDVSIAFFAGVMMCTPIFNLARTVSMRTPLGRLFVPWLAAVGPLAVLGLCMLCIGAGSHNPFIYYRF